MGSSIEFWKRLKRKIKLKCEIWFFGREKCILVRFEGKLLTSIFNSNSFFIIAGQFTSPKLTSPINKTKFLLFVSFQIIGGP